MNWLPYVWRLISGDRDFSFCHQVQTGCQVNLWSVQMTTHRCSFPVSVKRESMLVCNSTLPCRPPGITRGARTQTLRTLAISWLSESFQDSRLRPYPCSPLQAPRLFIVPFNSSAYKHWRQPFLNTLQTIHIFIYPLVVRFSQQCCWGLKPSGMVGLVGF